MVPLTEHIGAEIHGVDLRDVLTTETVRAIRAAWLKHIVLVFRGQQFGQEDLVRATSYFGEIGPMSRPPKYFPKGYSKLLPNVMMISNIRENGEVIGALPDGEMNFHHDMIHNEMPHNGTLLYSAEIPSFGGDTLFANCVLAIDARSGKLIWHYQTVHHDVWEYEIVAAPQLVTIHQNGQAIDVVAAASKSGFLYVLNRDTGKPIWPIEERPVPTSDMPGEKLSPTQPFPTKPPALARMNRRST